jgi:ABC-type multidrug transport system ATPase subunit
MIRVEGLSVRLGQAQVVDGLDFAVSAGESLALWGQNGAGKTTVIRALLGLVPFSGQVVLAGHQMPGEGRAARAHVGYVPQQLAYYEDMSALGLLRYLAALRAAPHGEPQALLAQVGLADHSAKAVGALSGGMKQRLALAAALLGDPPILLLDEPTASLDAGARSELTALIAGLRAAGKTLLVTTHRLAEVSALADRVLVMEGGRVRASCGAQELEAVLGLPARLHLRASGDMNQAVALLRAEGFTAQVNGRGLQVEAVPGRRAAPVVLLLAAGFAVDDIQIEEGS